MSTRGRLTIAVGVMLLGMPAVAWLLPSGASNDPAAPAAPPPVPLPIPTVNSPPPIPEVPPALLSAPLGREAQEALVERAGWFEVSSRAPQSRDVRVRYTLHPELTRSVWKVLESGRVALGHVAVMDANSGALLAYASTDPEQFSPERAYPAASLVKVITAAAVLDQGKTPPACRYRGNPWRLKRSGLDPARSGNEASLRRALSTSNNQCFAQWGVHQLGASVLLDAIDRFGVLMPAGYGHGAGRADEPGDDALALGKLASGLAGLSITPLHAVQLAAILNKGRRVTPYWVEGAWMGDGGALPVPATEGSQQVLTPDLAKELREMLVDTTTRGTARRAFRRRGRPLLKGVEVAGKTGSLNGSDPDGRYEWFIGVAPADAPRIAIATLAVQGPLYWMSGSQLAAEVLKAAFCPKGVCRVSAVDRFEERSSPKLAAESGGAAPSR